MPEPATPNPLTPNPLTPFIEEQGVVILDGGLATTLESYGHDLDDELWSARVLLDDPESVGRAHLEFLTAGADCIATSSYQASLAGFRKRGLGDDEGSRLLRLSVDLALAARDGFWSDARNKTSRMRPLVAASIGPYGAFLADGSEYKGRYGLTDDKLRGYHEHRWRILADSPADLLACETIPSRREARVLLALLRETPGRWAWISFSCRDGAHLSDGSRLEDVARDCDTETRLAAVGVNCTSPEFIPQLIEAARLGTDKPIIVYPNRGETYDPETKSWRVSTESLNWGQLAAEWRRLGADGVGGCCRVSSGEITEARSSLLGSSA
jgi:homocysteine S-methyltransferase